MASRIDWDAVRQRLAAAEAAMARAWEPEQVRAILKRRAAQLAKESGTGVPEGEMIEVVEFQLGRERYAAESRYVRDVFPLERLISLPCTPDFVPGIVDIRGEILSVVDLEKFLGLPKRGLTDMNRLVVLEQGEMRFCILADAILGVHAIPRSLVKQPLPGTDHVLGVAPDHLIILDVGKLTEDGRLIVDESA